VTPTDPPAPTGAQGSGASRNRTLIFTAVAAVLVIGLVFALLNRVASSGGTSAPRSSNSLAGQFDVGLARQRADTVDRSGPILFPDPQGHSRDIFVQHLGGNDWTAFEARATGSPRQCVLAWKQDAHHFVDPCDGRVYPADGTGLVTFPTTVDAKGRIIVDLGKPVQPAPPTVPSTTTAGAS
jgi:hypothetical protein